MDKEQHTTNTKIWGVIFYIINGRVTRKKLDDISHIGYFMIYASTTGVIIYCNPDQPFISTDTIMLGLMHIILFSPYNTNTLEVL